MQSRVRNDTTGSVTEVKPLEVAHKAEAWWLGYCLTSVLREEGIVPAHGQCSPSHKQGKATGV